MTLIPDSAIEELNAGAARLGHIGSVTDVIAARLPEALSGRKFKAPDYKYGFELASPRDTASLGEALIVNGLCYATSTDLSSPDYGRTISGPEFATGGMFLIPQDAKPSHRVSFNAGDTPLPLIDFYRELFGRFRQPMAFVGAAEFSDLHGTAIGKPPIDGRAIFEHREYYFPWPEPRARNVPAFIIGAFTDYREASLEAINAQLEVVLYRNPFDAASVLTHHAHVLTLKSAVGRIDEITPGMADQTLHLFVDGTLIRSINADIFTIGSIDSLLPAQRWILSD
jgi:hypothetical protein